MIAGIPIAPTRSCGQRRAAASAKLTWVGALGLLAVMWVALPQTGLAAPDPTRLSAPSALPEAQLRLVLTPRTTMVYEPRRLANPLPLAGDGQREAPPSLGLEFRSPPSQHGPRSILRVQLSGDAALQFRPRRGGLAISYRTQF